MPYRPTGRAPGRPPNPRVPSIIDLHTKAEGLDVWAHETRVKIAGLVASELASGTTHADLAAELGWATNDVRRALRARPVNLPKEQISTT